MPRLFNSATNHNPQPAPQIHVPPHHPIQPPHAYLFFAPPGRIITLHKVKIGGLGL